MKNFFIYLFCTFFAFNTFAQEDLSLIDLFGEEENKQSEDTDKAPQKNFSQPKAEQKTQNSTEEQVIEDGKKSKISDFFSFLNIPFFRTKDPAKQQELSRQENEPQENYVQRLSRLATDGDVDAALSLGYMYLYGVNGVKNDNEKAFKFYSIAAEQNDDIAINNLGSLYYSGIGTERNIPEATKLFEKATQMGNTESAVNLAFVYLTQNKEFDSKLRSTIVRLFNQAAEADNITAQYMLGMIYYKGFAIAKNDIKAFSYIKKAAEEYDEAQYQLALMYMNAEGTTKNYKNAVESLIRAGRQGHIKAMILLGDILSEGKNYPKNLVGAYIWYNIASVYTQDAEEKRDAIEAMLKLENILPAQEEAGKYKPAPTETTSYIKKTFGENIADYLNMIQKEPAY
ncbi:MAG: sel1 repeat family protein [Alphaproteobacteria bacterium]|nr:sel1 repeat family protein [Alphaproteobacteria bacterium]